MTTSKAKDLDLQKLVEEIDLPTIEGSIPIPALTNKRSYRIRRVAEPHLRPHKVKGKVYYFYCRGVDPEIYLGDAESILKKVKG